MKLSYNKLIIFKKNWTVKESFISKLFNLSLPFISKLLIYLFPIFHWLISSLYMSYHCLTFPLLSFFLHLSLFLPLSLCSFYNIISTCFFFHFISDHSILCTCLYLETSNSRLIEEELVFTLAHFECINIR